MIQTHLTTPYCSIFVLLEACSVALDDSWLRIILIYPTLYFGWAPHFMLCLEQAVLGPGRFLIGCSSWAEGFHSWWARFLCLLFMTSNRAKSRTPPLPRKARGFFLFGAFWLEMMTSLFDICAHFILTLTAVGLDNLTFPLGYVYLVRTRQGVLVQLIRLLDHSSMKTPPLYYGGDSLVGWPSSGRSRQLRTQSTLRQPRSWCWTFKAQTSCTYIETVYESLVPSAIFHGVVCWAQKGTEQGDQGGQLCSRMSSTPSGGSDSRMVAVREHLPPYAAPSETGCWTRRVWWRSTCTQWGLINPVVQCSTLHLCSH